MNLEMISIIHGFLVYNNFIVIRIVVELLTIL